MKSVFKKITAVISASVMLFIFAAGCSNVNDTEKTESSSVSEEKTPEKSPASDGAKYENADVYKKNGVPFSKTDDGQEVEISGENLQTLMSQYEKVKGSGSQEEKDILNKIQLILEAPKE